jgi:5-methylcytosine-specific restriction endonuclease McrA
MFSIMDYSEKLKDKRWKIKRLKILKRDRFRCKVCGYFGKKVDVHHLKYQGEPWEVEDKYLITLCRYCHRIVHMPELKDKKYELMQVGEIMKKLNDG